MCKQVITTIRKKYSNVEYDDTETMKQLVQELTRGLGIEPTKERPFPVVYMLNKMGFELFRSSFKNDKQSGLIAIDSSLPQQNPIFNTDRVVVVNRNDSTAHQRFTIAHEIAHYLFDFDEEKEPVYYDSYIPQDSKSLKELRANKFAAELLMPAKIFKKSYQELRQQQGDMYSLSDTITQLSKMFDAPATAIRLRLQETGCGL